MPYTEFHYTPTGTGVISGKEVLEQTEDAINDLGGQISGDVQTAIDTANNALNVANTASTDAQNAVNTANTAYTAATNAQNTANAAQNTASNALTAAQTAQNDVNALGNRVTTAENNITQNTTDISGLTTRMGTAEGNITTLQNDVITAQGTATSAQNTATMARQQAYVLRYSSIAITDNSIIAYSTLDNTDNIKVSDKIIDTDGKIFSIVSVDSDNSTVTVGSALIDLAQDSDVVHKDGNETVGGEKTFSDLQIIGYGTQYKGARNAYILPEFSAGYSGLAITTLGLSQAVKIGNFVLDANNRPSLDSSKGYIQFATGESNSVNTCVLEPRNSTSSSLGTSANRWSKIYGTEYYYGSNNVEFSTKFVTTDTNQTISGSKTFTWPIAITSYPGIRMYLSDDEWNVQPASAKQSEIRFTDKNAVLISYITFQHRTDANEPFRTCWRQQKMDGTSSYFSVNFNNLGEFYPENNNAIKLGTSTRRWKDCQTYLINGLAPSSLSLPGDTSIDISGYITDFSGGNNQYTAPDNGIVAVDISGTNRYVLYNNNLSIGDCLTGSNFRRAGIIQVRKNDTVIIQSDGGTLNYAKFYPCLGNV